MTWERTPLQTSECLLSEGKQNFRYFGDDYRIEYKSNYPRLKSLIDALGQVIASISIRTERGTATIRGRTLASAVSLSRADQGICLAVMLQCVLSSHRRVHLENSRLVNTNPLCMSVHTTYKVL